MKESIKELTKKTIIIIAVFLILLACVIPPKPIYAMSVERAGDFITEFAINFYEDYGDKVKYDLNADNRRMMYNGEKCSDGKYHCDCAGWVNFVLHQSLALEMGTNDDGGECSFVGPKGPNQEFGVREALELTYGGYDSKKSAEDIVSNAKPGDIILAWNHVMIYVGNGEVIHCAQDLQREQLSQSYYADKLYGIVRITDEAAAGINENDCTNIFGMTTGAGELDDYGLYWGTTTGKYTGSYTLGDWLFSVIGGFLDYLVGIMTYIIKIPFLGYTNIVEAMVNDFLQSLTGDEMRAVTNEEDEEKEESDQENAEEEGNEEEGSEEDGETVEETEASVEESGGISASGTNGTRVVLNNNGKLYKPTAKIETWDRVTIEDIIFNHIPILDVDIFSYDKAAGQELSEESIIYQIRQNIASWYSVIRNVSIAVMLLVLVFLGIKLAITSSSEKKANYKGMLMAWVSGFIVIFVIHYYMIVVITINQEFVKVFENISYNAADIEDEYGDEDEDEEKIKKGRTQSLYDTIRTRAYSFKFTEGIPGTIIYMVLVYYMIKYLYIYFKRYLTINILAIMAPAIGAKYAYDKIKSGKGGGVTTWMFDFFVNVFLQSIHALIYTVFVSIVLNLSTASLSGFVLALFTLNFMQKAEKIFINIFKFEGRGSSLSDTREYDFKKNWSTIVGFAMFSARAPKALWGGTKFVGKTVAKHTENITNAVGFSAYVIKNRNKAEEDMPEYKSFKFKNQLDKVKKLGEKIGDNINENGITIPGKGIPWIKGRRIKNINPYKGNSVRLSMHKYKESDPELYNAMKKALETAKKQRKAQRSRMIKTGFNAVTGTARVMAGIPMMIADGEAGSLMLITGIKALRSTSKKEKQYGYQAKEDYKKGLDDIIDDNVEKGLMYSTPAGVVKRSIDKANGKERSDNSRRRRRNVRKAVADISTLGLYSAATNEVGKFGKDIIDNKAILEKLNALSEMAGKEDEIDKIMKEINELENELEKEALADKKDKEKAKKEAREAREQRLEDTTSGASKEVVKGSTIAKVVEDYLFENDLTKVTDADIDSIMKRIIELEGSSGVKVVFDSKFKDNVRKSLQAKIDSKHGSSKSKRSFDKKDVVDIFEEAIVAEGSVKPHDREEKIVEKYVHENNLTKVTDSDLNKVMKKIAESRGVDVKSLEKAKDNIKKSIQTKIKGKLEDDKKSDRVKEIEEQLKGRYDSLKQSVKEMHAITERAKTRTGSSVVDASKHVKRVNAMQIAEKMKNRRKGGQ